MVITSRENKIYKLAVKLASRSGRERFGLFAVEGVRSVADAVKKGADIEHLIICDSFSCERIPCRNAYVFAKKLFAELSGTVTPQGVIALCRIPETKLEDISDEGGCVVLCEGVQDPGNIGTVIRTAHAAFCGGVVLSSGCCDLYNPKTVRATMSSIFSVPAVCRVTAAEAIEHFRSRGYRIICGALSPRAKSLYETDISGKTLIIVGNEGSGVTEETAALCDDIVKIPMRQDAESLNVSAAASVLIYEHYRQKNYGI